MSRLVVIVPVILLGLSGYAFSPPRAWVIRAERAEPKDGATGVAGAAAGATPAQGPVISGVQAVNVTGLEATITWITDIPATSVVHFGTTVPPGSIASNTALVTSHGVNVHGLQPCTTYHYWVESTDGGANGASDDNGGAYYAFTTRQNVQQSYPSTDTPRTIPSNSFSISTIAVADSRTVQDVNVSVNIGHTFDADLTISLITPTGAVITLADRRGASGDNYMNTVFDDEASTPISAGTAPFAASFRPETPLGAADGISAAGNWKLRVDDGGGLDSGALLSWALILTTPSPACGPHASHRSSALMNDTCSAGGTGSWDGVADAGEEIQVSISLLNDGNVPLTGVAATATSTTPGVVMTDGTASFPDIPVDGARTSFAPHLTAHLPSTLPCDSPVNFHLAIEANEGAFSDDFRMFVGQAAGGGATALAESFAGGIPGSWTVVDGGSGGSAAATWTTANPGNRAFTLPLVSPVAIVDSARAGSSAIQDEEMITQVLDLSPATSVFVQLDQYFRWYGNGLDEKGDVDVRSNLTGGAWVNVLRNQGGSSPNPDHHALDVTAMAAGADDVQIRFHYYSATFEWWWEVDNVQVTYLTPRSCSMTICSSCGSPPSEVNDTLALNHSAGTGVTTLIWADAPGPFNVYRGSAGSGSPWTYNQTCLASMTQGTSATDAAAPPPPGTIFFYLVTRKDACGESIPGQNSNRVPIPNESPCP